MQQRAYLAAVVAAVAVCAEATSGKPGQAGEAACAEGSAESGGSSAGTVLLAKSAVLNRKIDTHADMLLDLLPGRGDQRGFERRVRLMAQDRVAKAESGEGDSGAPADAVAKILGIIEDEVVADSLKTHQEDQDEVDRHARYVGECKANNLDNYTQIIEQGLNQTRDAETKYKTCDATEKLLKSSVDEACKKTHAKLRSMGTCKLSSSVDPVDLQTHIDCLQELADQLPKARELHKECASETSKFSVQSTECEGRQRDYNSTHCGAQVLLKTQSARYASCYARETARYNTTKAKVQEAEHARKSQAVAIEKIKCYLKDVIAANTTDLHVQGKARMAACDAMAGTNASAQYDIVYAAPPLQVDFPWRLEIDDKGMDCTPTTTSTTTVTVTTTTTVTTTAAVSCNVFRDDSGFKSWKYISIPAADVNNDFELKVLVKVTSSLTRTYNGIFGGDCGAFSLWLSSGSRGLFNERQCGPHPGESRIPFASNFQTGKRYWITIKRTGQQGKMTVNNADLSGAFGTEVATKAYNIGVANYHKGIQTLGSAHGGGREPFTSEIYCMSFEK